MKNPTQLTRRQFLVGAAAALSGLALTGVERRMAKAGPDAEGDVFIPLVANSPNTAGRVVHVQNLNATTWKGQADFYNYIDQSVVDDMVNQGMMALTGKSTVADAWHKILPDYQSGQKIAIKVNFNNHRACNDSDNVIDALPQPVNAVVSGLEQIGVARADIGVYDAVRVIPDWFANKILSNVGLYGKGGCGALANIAGFSMTSASRVAFNPPAGVSLPVEYVNDVLMNATYLINMPIMKGGHGNAGVTLGGKNHFGTIHKCYDSDIHKKITLNDPTFRMDYHPFVDFFRSPLIGGKTVVTIGDALIAGRQFDAAPQTWTIFGGKTPNSLFFSRDKVAIDCVMYDLLKAELGSALSVKANNYLRLAGQAGLGIFEHGNPLQTPYGSGYSQIQYMRI